MTIKGQTGETTISSLPSLISLMVSVDVKHHVYFTATISIGRFPLAGNCSQFVPALLVCCWVSRVCRSDLGIVLHMRTVLKCVLILWQCLVVLMRPSVHDGVKIQ